MLTSSNIKFGEIGAAPQLQSKINTTLDIPECYKSALKINEIAKIDQLDNILLKIEEDSKQSKENANKTTEINTSHNPWNDREKICTMIVDLKGKIFQCRNTTKVFRKEDLKGTNFFEVMAPYNSSYFRSMYGEDIILNIAKSNTIIRYSLDHAIDDLNPTIVSSKISLIYSNKQQSMEKEILGAKIISRLSSENSTKTFKNKITQATIKASTTIKHYLQEQMRLKEEIGWVIGSLDKDSKSKEKSKDVSPFDLAWDFSE